MVYSYEDLKAVKYAELLKISKSMNLKCGRQKAEKVMQQIIKHQATLSTEKIENSDEKDGGTEMLDDIEFPEHSLLSVDEISESPKSGKKKDKQFSSGTTGKRKRSLDSAEESQSSSDAKPHTLRRSNTFVIEKNTSKMSKSTDVTEILASLPIMIKSAEISSKCISSTRQRSFDEQDVESPSKRRRISNTKSSPIIKSPDLTCSEVLTAADIREVEESPLNPAFKLVNSRFKNLTARRSLRGHLLNSRLAGRISSFEAIPSPLIRNRVTMQDTNKPSIVTKQTTDKKLYDSGLRQRGLRSSTLTKNMPPKSSVNTTNVTPAQKTADNDGKSGIPRFVAYASKLKMPNFSRIHQKNFEKMEAVSDYLERKQLRAKNAQSSFCLSSSKKAAGGIFKPAVTTTKNYNFNFTATFGGSIASPKSSAVKKSITKVSIVKSKTSISLKEHKAKENRIPAAKTKLDFCKSQTNVTIKGRTTTDTRAAARPQLNQTRNFQAAVKKGPKIITNTERRAKQSDFLKGVRLNKRFQLQMAKRGVKLN